MLRLFDRQVSAFGSKHLLKPNRYGFNLVVEQGSRRVQSRGFMQSKLVEAKTRPDPGPAPKLSISERWKKYQSSKNNRKKIAAVMILFYSGVGYAGLKYLEATKHRATGQPAPYLKNGDEEVSSEPKSYIVAPHDTTEVYDQLAKEYDSKIWMEELTSYIWYMRRKLMKYVTGDALEVSVGTGRNLPWLKANQVKSLTLVDSSESMLEVAKEKFDKKFPDFDAAQFVHGHAEDLAALASKSGQRFDTVYESFGLCSHEDPDKALQNMRDLVKPGGRIVLLEHGRGTYDSMNKRMDERAEERAKEWGCRWNLDIDAIVKKSGLSIEYETRYHFGTIYFYVLTVPKLPTK